jgi:hypothetical protein
VSDGCREKHLERGEGAAKERRQLTRATPPAPPPRGGAIVVADPPEDGSRSVGAKWRENEGRPRDRRMVVRRRDGFFGVLLMEGERRREKGY